MKRRVVYKERWCLSRTEAERWVAYLEQRGWECIRILRSDMMLQAVVRKEVVHGPK